MVRSSSNSSNGHSTMVKGKINPDNNHQSSMTAINTAINGRVISKPYNKYGWFLDSEEAEYE